jgi:hypothetical protein
MDSRDDVFVGALAETPPVPEDLFGAVTGRINNRRRLIRGVWAMAACLFLAVGFGGYRALSPQPAPVADEAVQELQELSDFINGTTVEKDIDVYVLADELF